MSINWFDAHYGSNKGFVESKWHQLLYTFGRYTQNDIPWASVNRLVFVCSGNICRSAFAEFVAKSIEMDSVSAGVHAIHDAPANEQAIITAKAMGYDLSAHRTTPIMYPILKKNDLLIAMEPWQAELLMTNLARHHHITLLGMWGNPIKPYIPDPFHSSAAYFERCFNYIERSVHAIANKIRSAS